MNRRAASILLMVIVLAGAVRIASTYRVFSQVWDEPFHVACGMEWLDGGTYHYEYLHPPLARVLSALGPYLAGARSFNRLYMWDEGNDILHSGAGYWNNLILARAGILPFFLVASVLVFVWARRLAGNGAAVLAAILFTTLPPVLAHGGLATTDMAMTATFTGLMLAFTSWLDRPDASRGLLLGIALGAAVLSKYSTLVFLPACASAILALRWISERKSAKKPVFPPRAWIRSLALVLGIGFLIVWGGYRFSMGPVSPAHKRPHASIDRYLGSTGTAHDIAYAAAEAPVIPMPEYFRGVNDVRIKGQEGQRGQYLFGEVRVKSWWYYFLIVLAFKTPLAFLFLAGIGSVVLGRRWREDRDWRPIAPLLCAAAIFLACIPSDLKLGVRHLMPIYPFLAIIASVGAARLWDGGRFRIPGRIAAAGLVLWQIVPGALVHPDYLPYFNELAGKHPERILGDSDLDWGQDLDRLIRKLNAMGVKEASVAVASSADLRRFFPPEMEPLRPHERKGGWIVASVFRLEYDFSYTPPYDGFAWLKAYEPVAMAGKTMRIFHFPESHPMSENK